MGWGGVDRVGGVEWIGWGEVRWRVRWGGVDRVGWSGVDRVGWGGVEWIGCGGVEW